MARNCRSSQLLPPVRVVPAWLALVASRDEQEEVRSALRSATPLHLPPGEVIDERNATSRIALGGTGRCNQGVRGARSRTPRLAARDRPVGLHYSRNGGDPDRPAWATWPTYSPAASV